MLAQARQVVILRLVLQGYMPVVAKMIGSCLRYTNQDLSLQMFLIKCGSAAEFGGVQLNMIKYQQSHMEYTFPAWRLRIVPKLLVLRLGQ